jgi:branched-subunit amino acid transport protein
VSAAWVAIVLSMVGTYAMRGSFLFAAHRLADVPAGVQRLLRQIPPAALASIVALDVLRPRGDLEVWTPEVAAGVAAGLVAWRTKSATATLVAGMVVLVALRHA